MKVPVIGPPHEQCTPRQLGRLRGLKERSRYVVAYNLRLPGLHCPGKREVTLTWKESASIMRKETSEGGYSEIHIAAIVRGELAEKHVVQPRAARTVTVKPLQC